MFGYPRQPTPSDKRKEYYRKRFEDALKRFRELTPDQRWKPVFIQLTELTPPKGPGWGHGWGETIWVSAAEYEANKDKYKEGWSHGTQVSKIDTAKMFVMGWARKAGIDKADFFFYHYY